MGAAITIPQRRRGRNRQKPRSRSPIMTRFRENRPDFTIFVMFAISSPSRVRDRRRRRALPARPPPGRWRSAGIPVRLLDRAAFPRNKPCGGGISARVLRRFPYLGRELSRIATHTVSRLLSRRARRPVDGRRSRTSPAALMIRRVEFDALLVSLAVEAGAELVTGADIVQAREDAGRVTLTARDGRRFDGADRDRRRRRPQRRRASARAESADGRRRRVALDMMEETPREQLRDRRSVAMRLVRSPSRYQVDARRGLRVHLSEARSRQHRHRLRAVAFPRGDRRGAVRRCSAGSSSSCATAASSPASRCRENFTPFLIPDRRAAARAGPRPRAARRRRRRIRQRGHRRRDLLRDGVGRARGASRLRRAADVATLAARYRRACDDEIGAELRDSVRIQRFLFADRRRIGRLIDGAHRESGDDALDARTSSIGPPLVSRPAAPDPVALAAPCLLCLSMSVRELRLRA